MPVLPDWYVCISIALDAEENEWYNQQYLAYIGAGGDPKKFPKRPQPYVEPEQKASQQINPFQMIMDAVGGGDVQMKGIRGTVDEYASTRGLEKVFRLPDGTLVDKNGEPVEPKPGSVFVQSKGA